MPDGYRSGSSGRCNLRVDTPRHKQVFGVRHERVMGLAGFVRYYMLLLVRRREKVDATAGLKCRIVIVVGGGLSCESLVSGCSVAGDQGRFGLSGTDYQADMR